MDNTASQRSEFVLPTNGSISATRVESDHDPCVYLCGNSLGALAKQSRKLVEQEFDVWASRAVEGHFDHPYGRPWMTIADQVTPLLAELVGANEEEVACMGGLTNNLHLMMDTFYRPTATRYKILCEAKAFPSDQYAFASQAESHGLDPSTAVIALSPRPGEYTLREEDILSTIEKSGAEIALVIFSGIQFYTGQWFPMQKITQAAKKKGCICGWDLAHAVGNVPVQLHDWDVDFAVWCSYKYLNGGAGAIAGLFVHDKWSDTKPRQAGWWGHDQNTRFSMPPKFSPIRGAHGFQQSNPNVLSVVSLLGSLQIFKKAGMMKPLRDRSLQLTGHLEKLLTSSKWYVPVTEVRERYGASAEFKEDDSVSGAKNEHPAASELISRMGFTIITPHDPENRGAQLSLLVLPPRQGVMQNLFAGLKDFGILGDEREPDVIRLAPTPLYNTLEDCEEAASALNKVFDIFSQQGKIKWESMH